jgi:5-methylcytosine-specific restriction endonuclease McrA
MLTSSVLVLNRSYFPVHITTVKRACVMLYQGMARAVDREYQTFTFDSWMELSTVEHDETVGLVDQIMRVPRVVLLTAYDRIPKRAIRFSRLNIMMRDRYACQYCGKHYPSQELNLDHVTPRAQGGVTAWENIVTSCHPCNRRKGGRTPEEARMQLTRRPYRPTSLPFLHLHLKHFRYEEWRPFLNVVDYSYWNVELTP